MKNGKIDKILFDGGYAQDTSANSTTDKFAFYYYNQDHLGNNREVVDANGVVQQVTNYYPFGAPYVDATAVKCDSLQPYKYNGKELDLMHGLNTYDYGARQHDPILCRWDRIDPLCEKYYNVSPYNYCHNNPIIMIDPNGMDDYYTSDGVFLGTNNKKTDYIYISDSYKQQKDGRYAIYSRVGLPKLDISAKALSKIFSHVVSRMKGVDLSKIEGGAFAVAKLEQGNGGYDDINTLDSYGNINTSYVRWGTQNAVTKGNNITVDFGMGNEYMFATRSNIQNMLGVHEYINHFWNKLSHWKGDGITPDKQQNIKLFDSVMSDPTWNKTTDSYKKAVTDEKASYLPGN